jgi:uncharacterized protein (DUF2345 family)
MTVAGDDAVHAVLEDVAAPLQSADVTLASGRRYALEAGDGADRLTIRSRSGDVVLRIEVSDRGPVLSFAAAEIDIAAAGRLRLAAERVDVEATSDMTLSAGGSITERAARDHHVQSGANARLEAAAVEMQASSGGVGVRAMRAIRLDGEHIGLNDDPLPAPFPWSELAAITAGTEDEP